jgi:hypothetical protein
MKRFLIGIAALFLATGTAHAGRYNRPQAMPDLGDKAFQICAKKYPKLGPFSFPRLRWAREANLSGGAGHLAYRSMREQPR